jgi:acetyl esterase/lipase
VNADYRFGVPEASEDAAKALAWCFATISRYGGDPEKMIVTGESAGAHLALLAGLRSPKPVAAIININFYGITDVLRFRAIPIHAGDAGASIDRGPRFFRFTVSGIPKFRSIVPKY